MLVCGVCISKKATYPVIASYNLRLLERDSLKEYYDQECFVCHKFIVRE